MTSQEWPEQEQWTAERLCRASYKDLGSPAEVESRFLRHLLSLDSCRESLQVLLTSTSTTTRDYSLEIDAFDLLEADPVLGHLLLRYPSTLLPLLENAIVQAQNELQRQLQEQEQPQQDNDTTAPTTFLIKGDKGDGKGLPATRVHARLVHLPPTCCRASVATMESKDVGKIVQLSGTVVRTSPVQMYESARTYKCTGKQGCSRTFVQCADLEQRTNALTKPDRCPLTVEGGQRCKGTNLQLEKDGSVHTDYQEIKIQEAASRIGIGNIPRSLMIKLQHDLVDKCQPGDEVVVVGSLLAQWQQSVQPEVDCKIGMALNAHSIRVVQENGSSAWKSADASTSVGELDKFRKEFDTFWEDPHNQSQPIAARDFICKAVCPKLYGLQVIKLSLLITLIGGVSSDVCAKEKQQDAGGPSTPTGPLHDQSNTTEDHHAPDPFRMIQNEGTPTQTLYYERNTKQQGDQEAVQTRRRDMSHMLLVGDPGTGKSQFLRFAAALCPRSVLTTGVGTTSAGLTCAAVREGSGKEFSLEAGALVLADKGVCCIDEFGCIRNEDRTTIHEAMEQQTLSVAKAGIVCKLNCRATVIAVMNPRDCIYDNHASLSTNTGLGTPLLSRFDLIFKLVDTSDAERDSNVTTYLLNRAIQGSGFECSNAGTGTGMAQELPWTMEKLRAYISLVKERFQPVISDEAATLLESHYEKIRSAQSSVIPVTVRFLESLIRLSQAHARLMYHNIVTLEDAVAVLRIMECSAFAYGGFDGNVDDVENILYCDPMTIDVSNQEPDEDFAVFEYQILVRYGMTERLSEDRRQRALQLLNGGDDEDIMGYGDPAMAFGASGWGEMENPRDKQSSIVHDHYGRSYFSPPNSQGSARKRRRQK